MAALLKYCLFWVFRVRQNYNMSQESLSLHVFNRSFQKTGRMPKCEFSNCQLDFSKCKNIWLQSILFTTMLPSVTNTKSSHFHCCNVGSCFVVFKRWHYNKALLLALSIFHHWQENSTTIYQTMCSCLVTLNNTQLRIFTPLYCAD